MGRIIKLKVEQCVGRCRWWSEGGNTEQVLWIRVLGSAQHFNLTSQYDKHTFGVCVIDFSILLKCLDKDSSRLHLNYIKKPPRIYFNITLPLSLSLSHTPIVFLSVKVRVEKELNLTQTMRQLKII